MSVTSNVLIKTDDAPEAIIRVLGHLSLEFRTGRNALDEIIFVARSLGLELVLIPNPELLDDMGIEFSRFNFNLVLRALWPDDHSDELRQAAALYIHGRLGAVTSWQLMAAEDMQAVLVEVGQ